MMMTIVMMTIVMMMIEGDCSEVLMMMMIEGDCSDDNDDSGCSSGTYTVLISYSIFCIHELSADLIPA